MAKQEQWVEKWKTWLAPQPALPGVWKCRDGGWLVRASAVDPRTGKLVEVRRRRHDETPELALSWLETRLDEIRRGEKQGPSTTVPRFNEYSFALLERKIAQRDIRSPKGKKKWLDLLCTREKKDHDGNIIEPAKPTHLGLRWGEWYMDQITRLALIEWRTELGSKINRGEYTPNSVNTWVGVMRVIMKTFYEDRELDGEPWTALKPFDTCDHPTYTDDQPNSLESNGTTNEVKPFLNAMRALFPQHYAMTFFGFITGLRPSMFRPIRRKGADADFDFTTGRVKIRQSQTAGEAPIPTVKNKRNYTITLPDEALKVLQWHVDNCLVDAMKDSDLLFPSTTGGFRSPSVLDKPFAEVSRVLGLQKHLTPRAMRRTYQDLYREARVLDMVTRSISGHLDEKSQELYSTVRAHEQREAIAKVISMTGLLEAARLDEKPDQDKLRMREGAIVALRRRAG